jgi:MYXO-CTERM domain-containing protein
VDGHNVVYFMADGYAEAGEALAVTLVSFDDATGEIIDADIVINGRYAFAVLAADCTPTSEDVAIPNDPVEQTTAPYAYGSAEPFDLVHVVAHETGHLLGLLDAVAEPNDLMFLYTSPHDAARRAPAPDDVAGLDALYSTSSQGCTMAPGPHGASDMGLFLLAPLAGFAVRRRRVRSP